MKIIDLLTQIDTEPTTWINRKEAKALRVLGLAVKSGYGGNDTRISMKLTADGRDLLHGASERRLSA